MSNEIDESSPDIEEITGGAYEGVPDEIEDRIEFLDSNGDIVASPQVYVRHKRTIVEIERDRQFIAERYLEGKTQYQIMMALNEIRDYDLSRPTISNEIQAILKSWRLSTLKSTEMIVARELERLAKLESEYWDAWYESEKDAEIIELYDYTDDGETQREIDESGKRTKGRPRKRELARKVVIEGRTGDPRYLQGIERCIELRMRLLGLDQGKTVNVNWRKMAEKDGVDADRLITEMAESLFKAGVAVVTSEEEE